MFQQRLGRFLHNKQTPILILLAISLLVGLYTFQDYGMAWDEYV